MKILVCISKAPDTTSRIAFTEGDTQFDANGVQFIVNPYDEWYALVRALELKEQHGGSVTTLTVGQADCDPVIRKALAIGADDAIRIDANPVDAMQVATLIAEQARQGAYDVILCGKETIDHNGSAVGGMLALAARAQRGGSYHVNASLCQSAMWLQRHGLVPDRHVGRSIVPVDHFGFGSKDGLVDLEEAVPGRRHGGAGLRGVRGGVLRAPVDDRRGPRRPPRAARRRGLRRRARAVSYTHLTLPTKA